MGHSAEARPMDRISRVGSPVNLSGTNVLSSTSSARDSCHCSHHDDDARRVVERVDHAQSSDLTSTNSYPCASHMTHNQLNSLSRPDIRQSRSWRTPSASSSSTTTTTSSSSSSSSSHTDSVLSSKRATTTTTPDLRRNSHASSLSCSWFSRRMYMGNIKPWTLSFMFYLFVIVLSHQVESTHSVPMLSRRVVEQRMRKVNSLEGYLSALSLNDTTTLRSRYFVNRSPTAVNKRSYRRLGRAGSSGGLSIGSPFLAKLEDENARVQCQPRDRVVDSYEELGIPRGYGDFLYPECIVVRRCKQGGCCGDERECVPSRTTNITMNFLKTGREITREIVHDLECECQDKPSFCPEPVVDCPNNKVWSYSECTCKCRNRCPKPFLQDEDTCGCDCLSQDRNCKNIYRGRRNGKLSREECDCVRKGLCGYPPCINGGFSISDCKCINSNS